MDSTNDTNELRWPLYSLMVRDRYGSWQPVAHFLTKFEDSDVAAACLREIKRWAGGTNSWKLRYMITDDSAGEQCAVRKVWKGLSAGEMEVTHLLCKVSFLNFV